MAFHTLLMTTMMMITSDDDDDSDRFQEERNRRRQSSCARLSDDDVVKELSSFSSIHLVAAQSCSVIIVSVSTREASHVSRSPRAFILCRPR